MLIAGNVSQTAADRGWKIPDDIGRVVRLVMDVQRLVVGLAKRVKAFG